MVKENIKDIIESSLNKAISYQEYRELVSKLVSNNSTSGNEKTEALVNYTMLNDRRMKRWDKTVKIPVTLKDAIESVSQDMTWLIITESWCGDAAHVMPVLNKIAELNDKITIKVVFRDENDALMDQFLTNGSRSIAKIIMIDDASGDVINTYGPRPSVATNMVLDYKAEHGALTPEFKEDLQRWYNKDKGQTIISDILSLIS